MSTLLLLAAAAVTLAQNLAADEEAAVRAAIASVADSVVQIRTIGGLDEVERTLLPDGPTTGLVISPDGWIVSSSFNFVQQPASILVTFADGQQAPAALVAKDHSRMLVLLKAQGVSGLAVPELVPSDEIRVGQWAIAVGRTFRPDRTNISVGIVSALGRMFGRVIQTDADVSTANYGGPLVDIRGRVLGIIVPIAPQTTSEVAGAEWYDSGIGFAVPLATWSRISETRMPVSERPAHVSSPLERMKRGEDQRSGVLGISMAAESPHATPAELVAVPPNTPAGKAGLRKGDRITAINGSPIRVQTDLRFALGPLYAGEEVRVELKRGEETLERTITLAGELEPFRHAFLGILPIRSAVESDANDVGGVSDADDANESKPSSASERPPTNREDGLVVRFVYPNSPAAAADVRAGDRIVQIDDAKIGGIAEAIAALNGVTPESDVLLRIERGEQAIDAKLTAARVPTNVPSDLPPATQPPADAAPAAEMKPRELKLAEFPETCQVFVPPSHEAGQAAGVLLWIHAPGSPPDEEHFRRWQAICDRDGLLLVVPTAADPNRWERTELEYLRRLTERVLADFRVDRQRVVVVGDGSGGAMAYLLALVGRDVFTGVATTGAPLPRTVKVPPNDPATRLAIYAGLPTDGGRLAQVRQGLQKLADAGYPVTAVTIASPEAHLSDNDREELARWIDTLDRL